MEKGGEQVVDTRPRVALVSGFWGQNIGNAFFNVGGKWILDQLFGPENVAYIQDQPGYRTFHDGMKGNPERDFGLLSRLDVDYLVLQGPVLTQSMAALWGPTLRALQSRGTKILLIGAAFFKFTDAEITAARSFVESFRPHLVSTRDSRSFQVIKGWDLKSPIYDGLDSAFFIQRAVTPVRVVDDYYAFNFDRYPEPNVKLVEEGDPVAAFSADGVGWALNVPTMVSKLAHRSKVQAYLGHAIDRRSLPSMINGRWIVRPEHRFNPHMTRKIYQHPNAVASDEPWTYFTLYANSRLTLADRVHACVATLAYGNPAMLFTPSPRAALFERLGLGHIKRQPVSLNADRLEQEQESQHSWWSA